MSSAESLAEVTDVVQILRQWEEEHSSPAYDPIPTLQRLAEIIELETENYLKMDPDPFDERHPSRTDPECNFGHILKVLFRKDNFMTKLINDYLRDSYWSRLGLPTRDVRKLNISACRLMLDILPGLETSAVFQPDMEALIHRLFSWAERSQEPLQSYATGLLAAAMEVQDIATGFREQNGRMVPLMLRRLHKLQEKAREDRRVAVDCNGRPFARFGRGQEQDGRSLPSKRKTRDKSKEKPTNGCPIDSTVSQNPLKRLRTAPTNGRTQQESLLSHQQSLLGQETRQESLLSQETQLQSLESDRQGVLSEETQLEVQQSFLSQETRQESMPSHRQSFLSQETQGKSLPSHQKSLLSEETQLEVQQSLLSEETQGESLERHRQSVESEELEVQENNRQSLESEEVEQQTQKGQQVEEQTLKAQRQTEQTHKSQQKSQKTLQGQQQTLRSQKSQQQSLQTPQSQKSQQQSLQTPQSQKSQQPSQQQTLKSQKSQQQSLQSQQQAQKSEKSQQQTLNSQQTEQQSLQSQQQSLQTLKSQQQTLKSQKSQQQTPQSQQQTTKSQKTQQSQQNSQQAQQQTLNSQQTEQQSQKSQQNSQQAQQQTLNSQQSQPQSLQTPQSQHQAQQQTPKSQKSQQNSQQAQQQTLNSQQSQQQTPKSQKSQQNSQKAQQQSVQQFEAGNSNSSWAEMESYVIGNVQIHPPTLATRQMLILRYLTPMGEYQEFLGHVFEQNALDSILAYINVRETKDSRLAFESLKYLASLLCHKKFSIEFLNVSGLQRLLDVPRPSVAATGVSICLYYLAYCEDAMERVCLLPRHAISDLVTYALWLLERSHDSGRCHATMFFGFSFPFKVILEEFDAQDGLRKLFNVISTLPILNIEEEPTLNDDEECASRQIVRHVAVALKRYMEAHLHLKWEQLHRAEQQQNREDGYQQFSVPGYKACRLSCEEVQSKVESLQELMSVRALWPPVEELHRLGGITLLLQIIAFAREWNYSGRVHTSSSAETVRSCLDVIAICSVVPKVMLLLCERVDIPDTSMTMAINLLLAAAECEIIADADVQRAALRALINCVCGPISRVGGSVGRFSVAGTARRRASVNNSEELIEKVWESVRSNNGIMVLLQLMMVKTPITDADSIRALACRALAGLARSEKVRQIISKLPMFTDGQIQALMKDPILQEKRQEHVTFQKYALELLERVSGKAKPTGAEYEISLVSLHRANVVAQTRIQYNEQQLNQLIHQHLVSKGLTETASTLRREASLESAVSQKPTYRGLVSLYGSGRGQRLDTIAQDGRTVGRLKECQPIKLQINQKRSERNTQQQISSYSYRSLQKQISRDIGVLDVHGRPAANQNVITLDSIITEYLTNQHALCKNPMVTCPQFNLFEPHKCPDPRIQRAPPSNVAVRLAWRAWAPPTAAQAHGRRLDRRHVYSRFCPVKTFRPADVVTFTCCTFSPCQQYLMLGTYSGDVKMFNLHTGAEKVTYQCHESYVYHMECSQRGNLLLTSTAWRSPMSALWSIGTFFDMRLPLENEDYVEFGKLQDRIIGTQGESATIYDISTGKLLSTLTPSISNQYTKNRATFSMNDELVLSDGILWDVNSGKEIHKFDKLNQTLNGVFHPNGTEVVSNTEVWDLRTFHLLKTVPTLDQMEVIFSPVNSVIYAVSLDQENWDESHYVTSFKTVDALDYSNIATCDVKRGIYGLASNRSDTQIAIVENQGEFDSVQESCVRLYDVGRRRDDEDEAEEDEDEEDMEASEDDGSNSASDDNNADDVSHADALAEGVADAVGRNEEEEEDEEDEDDEDEDEDDEDEEEDEDEDEDEEDLERPIRRRRNDANEIDEDFFLSDVDDFEILFS